MIAIEPIIFVTKTVIANTRVFIYFIALNWCTVIKSTMLYYLVWCERLLNFLITRFKQNNFL